MFKKIVKAVSLRFYLQFVDRLKRDLHVHEQTQILHNIMQQITIRNEKLKHLENQLRMTNILIGSIDQPYSENDAMLNPTQITEDIINIFQYKPSDLTVIQTVETMTKHFFKGKSVCIIGSNNRLFVEEIRSKGAKDIISIEMNPFIMKRADTAQGTTLYVYPSLLPTVELPGFDILFSPNAAVNSYMLKYNLFHLGSKTRENGVFVLSGDKKTTTYLRTHIHTSGFAEVTDNKKVKTEFSYADLEKSRIEVKQPHHKSETIICVASKLATVPTTS